MKNFHATEMDLPEITNFTDGQSEKPHSPSLRENIQSYINHTSSISGELNQPFIDTHDIKSIELEPTPLAQLKRSEDVFTQTQPDLKPKGYFRTFKSTLTSYKKPLQ